MKKASSGSFLTTTFLLVIGLLFLVPAVSQAAGTATVSWTPPTTDEGGGSLTGLAGYKVFYDTSSNWLGMVGTCLLGLSGTEVDVPGGTEDSYRFFNNLTAGQTYYFAVAAYDDADPVNVSGCAITDIGGFTEVSKAVTYTGDLEADNDVDIWDFGAFVADFGAQVTGPADLDKDADVDIWDFGYFVEDFGQSF